MKILTILGARPQFIKASAFSRAIRDYNHNNRSDILEIIVHTGQHFDRDMSDIFFNELEINKPSYNLGISSLNHGAMTGKMMEGIEEIIINESPDFVVVFGDTNSTLAGALAAKKIHVPIAHIEAGLRSYNLRMPEEVNRILTDRISSFLFCPTATALENLKKEGFPFLTDNNAEQTISNTGDIMFDVTEFYKDKAKKIIDISKWGISDNEFCLSTIHRAENIKESQNLSQIIQSISEINSYCPVLLPLHPGTRIAIEKAGLMHYLDNMIVTNPLSYLEMQRLQSTAKCIITDSGGIQKEAFFHKTPCITLREETEWIETIDLGWNSLVGHKKKNILDAWHTLDDLKKIHGDPYGNGMSANNILNLLVGNI